MARFIMYSQSGESLGTRDAPDAHMAIIWFNQNLPWDAPHAVSAHTIAKVNELSELEKLEKLDDLSRRIAALESAMMLGMLKPATDIKQLFDKTRERLPNFVTRERFVKSQDLARKVQGERDAALEANRNLVKELAEQSARHEESAAALAKEVAALKEAAEFFASYNKTLINELAVARIDAKNLRLDNDGLRRRFMPV